MPQYVEATTATSATATSATSTFLAEFGDLLPDVVKVAAPSSQNGYGEATLAAPRSYRARIMHKTSARRDLNGVEFTSPTNVVLDCQTLIPVDSLLTFPDATTHIVRDSELFRNENNLPHHATVYLAD